MDVDIPDKDVAILGHLLGGDRVAVVRGRITPDDVTINPYMGLANLPYKGDNVSMHYIDCRMPVDLHEWLRLRAFLLHESKNSVVLDAVKEYRAMVEAGTLTPRRADGSVGPVARYRPCFDDDLYEWLRTTAFYARLPINVLLVAALVRYRSAHESDTIVPVQR